MATRLFLFIMVCEVALGLQPGTMNPVRYTVANAPPGRESYPYRGKHFEVLSRPIRYKYSQVFWTIQKEVPLPEDIVREFDGKTMVVSGYEFDVVRKGNGTAYSSVPCYEHYNHHYVAWINGKNMVMEHRTGKEQLAGHSMGVPHQVPSTPKGAKIPNNAWFSEGNGNEARTSFHGYPHEYGQFVESPVSFLPGPMMINTQSSKRRGGMQPKSSTQPPDSDVNGMIECPCTTRVNKTYIYAAQVKDTCKDPISTEDKCLTAADSLGVGLFDHSSLIKISSKAKPPGCSITPGSDGKMALQFNTLTQSPVPCGNEAKNTSLATGQVSALVHVDLAVDGAKQVAQITLTGPKDAWFGVGFGADNMAGNPYAIVVEGDGTVMERALGEHAPGEVLKPSVRVVSTEENGDLRTVHLERPLELHSKGYYTFSPLAGTISIINAVGSGPKFSYHKDKGAASITLTIKGATSCVCGAGGQINGINFGRGCRTDSQIYKENNPTCALETYEGGLSCCRHGTFLLDKEQDIPDQEDEIFMKFRFYYEDVTPKHRHLFRLFLAAEENGEYDIVQAPAGTPPQSRIHIIDYTFTFEEMMKGSCDIAYDPACQVSDEIKSKGAYLIYAGGHCHSPACLSMDLYNAETGNLLCSNKPIWGKTDALYDEKGFATLPPCLWGSQEEGLQPPPLLYPKTKLRAVGTYNNTLSHYGVMSFWQMRGAYVEHYM